MNQGGELRSVFVPSDRMLYVRDFLAWLAVQCKALEKRLDKYPPPTSERDRIALEFSMVLEQRGLGRTGCIGIRWIPGIGYEVRADMAVVCAEAAATAPRYYIPDSWSEGSIYET